MQRRRKGALAALAVLAAAAARAAELDRLKQGAVSFDGAPGDGFSIDASSLAPRGDSTFQKDGRDFRRITGTPNDLLNPTGVPPCAPERGLTGGCELLDPNRPPGLGGYYYGLFLGRDGKLHYGKVYVPFYGPFDGAFHNNPPELDPNRRQPPVPELQRKPGDPQ